jgi:hypothetical protein
MRQEDRRQEDDPNACGTGTIFLSSIFLSSGAESGRKLGLFDASIVAS